MILENSVAIVTGGSSGIGLAIGQALARAGSRVALCARSPDRLAAPIAQLQHEGHQVFGQACDVRDRNSVTDFVAAARETFGAIDVLVNNAGVGYLRPLLELADTEIDEVLAVNVRGMFNLTRAVLPEMLSRGTGHVVNIASLAGKNGFAGGTVYAASKHAVLGFGRSLMMEVRNRGVRVLTICPGSVSTDFFLRAGVDPPDPERILQPNDVAVAVVAALTLPDRCTVSELDMRPTSP